MEKSLNKNTIKKEIYKQKPKAFFQFIRKGVAYYMTNVLIGTDTVGFSVEVPVDDMGDADFHKEMDAHLMLRWINPDVTYFNIEIK